MPKHYVTFGTAHHHNIDGNRLHAGTVARFEADSPSEGRKKAFELFGPQFSMEYHEGQWNKIEMIFYPDGYVDID